MLQPAAVEVDIFYDSTFFKKWIWEINYTYFVNEIQNDNLKSFAHVMVENKELYDFLLAKWFVIKNGALPNT